MKVDRNFNIRTAPLVDVQLPVVQHDKGDALGILVTLWPVVGNDISENRPNNIGCLRMHLTPDEAITLGLSLIAAAQALLK